MRWLVGAVLGAIAVASWLAVAPGEALPPAAAAPAAVASPLDFPRAADAIRRRDLDAAWATLAPLTTDDGVGGRRARLVAGLYAHALERTDLAVELLSAAAEPGGALEDWRLWALADSLAARGAVPAARATLIELAQLHPASPLHDRAVRRAFELAADQGDVAGTVASAAAARQTLTDPEARRALALLAWDLASRHRLEEERRRLAKTLLVDHPLDASKLAVIELLRAPAGEVPWRQLFTASELCARARNLLAVGLADGALKALAEVAAEERDLEWALLQAEALTAEARGAEALAVLGGHPPPTGPERADYLWRAAEAGLEAATARSGRANLPSDRRQTLRAAALRDLRELAQTGDRETAKRALLRLWQELDLEEQFDQAIDALARLRALDAADTTGAQALWTMAWREFKDGNLTGAIGTWSELEGLYPLTRWARGARYWSAVAHQRLGNDERGRALLSSLLLADTEDFYARHAAARLGAAPAREPPVVTPRPWPEEDGALVRARLLSELGLDALALTELEGRAAEADARAVDALRATVLARQGDRRESIRALWRVFTELGGAHQAAVPEDARRMYYPLDHYETVVEHASRQQLSPFLVMAMIRQESAFDTRAVSRSGARGLMQLMPATARELAAKLGLPYGSDRLFDPDYSVRLGTRYFGQVLGMFDGNVELALAGYNGGPYRIRKWWSEAGGRVGVDEFVEDLGTTLAESRTYVLRILVYADSYQQLYGERG